MKHPAAIHPVSRGRVARSEAADHDEQILRQVVAFQDEHGGRRPKETRSADNECQLAKTYRRVSNRAKKAPHSTSQVVQDLLQQIARRAGVESSQTASSTSGVQVSPDAFSTPVKKRSKVVHASPEQAELSSARASTVATVASGSPLLSPAAARALAESTRCASIEAVLPAKARMRVPDAAPLCIEV